MFQNKTHLNLIQFKGRNVYLWIKVYNDLLLVVIEIVTTHLSRSREGEQGRAREKVLL